MSRLSYVMTWRHVIYRGSPSSMYAAHVFPSADQLICNMETGLGQRDAGNVRTWWHLGESWLVRWRLSPLAPQYQHLPHGHSVARDRDTAVKWVWTPPFPPSPPLLLFFLLPPSPLSFPPSFVFILFLPPSPPTCGLGFLFPLLFGLSGLRGENSSTTVFLRALEQETKTKYKRRWESVEDEEEDEGKTEGNMRRRKREMR